MADFPATRLSPQVSPGFDTTPSDLASFNTAPAPPSWLASNGDPDNPPGGYAPERPRVRRRRSKKRRVLAPVATQTQINLPLDYAPPRVREHGLRDAHSKPLASWGRGLASWRSTPERAWHYPLLELDRTGNSYAAIGLDVDGRDRVVEFLEAVASRRLPEPNFLVERRESGNVQAHFCLAVPVHRGPDARERPLRALVRVAEYLVVEAQADEGFTGVLCRNPMESVHRDARAVDGPCRTLWGRREPYTLRELTNIIPLGWKRPTVAVSAIGRNVTLFRNLMRETGKKRNWGKPVLPLAIAMADGIRRTLDGDHPFTDREVRDTAASVERYQSRNLETGKTQAGYKAILSALGRRGGLKSGQVRRRGSVTESQPWQAEGVSRATWYRRQIVQLELSDKRAQA